MRLVSTFEAKNKLSEIILAAEEGEPQIITRNGKETAVVISYSEFRRLTARTQSLNEFLLASPLRESEIDLTRNKDRGRSSISFEE